MNQHKRTTPLRAARVIRCLEVAVLEGDDTEEDLCREVRYYVRFDGTVLAINDPAMQSSATWPNFSEGL